MDIQLQIFLITLFIVFLAFLILDSLFRLLGVKVLVFKFLRILIVGLAIIVFIGVFGFSFDFQEAFLSALNRVVYRIIFLILVFLVIIGIYLLYAYTHVRKGVRSNGELLREFRLESEPSPQPLWLTLRRSWFLSAE